MPADAAALVGDRPAPAGNLPAPLTAVAARVIAAPVIAAPFIMVGADDAGLCVDGVCALPSANPQA